MTEPFSLDGAHVLVTGGTGSFGQRFCKTVLERFRPERLIVYSRDELKQFDMQNAEPFAQHVDIMRFFIGDVRDEARLRKAMERVDVVIHAAALKQVPAAEYNPFECIKTNILGAQNVVEAALGSPSVRRVIALSTDKAAAPINLYGASKLASDKLFIAANNHRGDRDIRFSVVRYGNVLGSRGSVVPFFLKRRGDGILPTTDAAMTRFTITLQEAVDLVLDVLDRLWGGELYVPKIPSFRITDLARAIAPQARHEVLGIRPGEKLHEEMITSTDSLATIEFPDYFVILPSTPLWDIERFAAESDAKTGWRCAPGFCYNSGGNDRFLSVPELRALISQELQVELSS